MSQKFPFWINGVSELDIVYEGLHAVLSHCHYASNSLTTDITRLEREIAWYLDNNMTEDEEVVKYKEQLRNKKILVVQIGVKIVTTHQLMKYLSDPSVPQKLKDEFYERKRREDILRLIDKQNKELNTETVHGAGMPVPKKAK